MPTDRWFDNEDPALRRCWHPVAWADAVADDEIVAVELLGEHWAVARLDGRVAAFRDACPHRMSPLSAGSIIDGTLRCAYHGYRFASDGHCVEIPAQDPRLPIPKAAHCPTPARVAEHLGIIWIAPEEPLIGLPVVPEHDDPSFVRAPLPMLEWNASAAQMADNFLDLGHFAFLHLGTFGDPTDRIVSPYTLERDGWTFTAIHNHVTKLLADSHGSPEDFQSAERESHFVFTAPHHVYLKITYPSENAILTISFCHQPVNATTTRLYCTDYRNDISDTEEGRASAVAFQMAVGAEDRALLERMWRKAIPLDVTAEVHTKADRITLEMRRVLVDLVAATSV